MTQALSVVVPAYKEEANIERFYERLRAVLDDLGLEWELIFSVDPVAGPHRGWPSAARTAARSAAS